MARGYTVKTGAAATALAAATAKTLVNIIAGAAGVIIVEWHVSLDGVTASAVPVLIELCGSTQATAGTVGTSPTPTPIRPFGSVDAASATAGVDYTAEPTVLAAFKHYLVTPNGGFLTLQYPLGREPFTTSAAASAAKGFCLRVTAPAIVNARAYIEFEE